MIASEVEVWGGPGCKDCEDMKEKLLAAGFAVVSKNFDDLDEEPMLKKVDLKGAYSFTECYPILFYDGAAFTPDEFDRKFD